jgi:hypothetical protein
MIPRVLATSLSLWLLAAASDVAEEVVWVTEIDSTPSLVGKDVVLEGRFLGVFGATRDQIRLKNLNPDRVELRLDRDTDRKFPSALRFIRVEGRLSESGGKLLLVVKMWSKITATDEDRYRDSARRIRDDDHQAWYELGRRTQRLAEFYGEDSLKALASEARIRGFHAEEVVLRPTQPAELLALADRVAEVGLDAEEARRMRHKALRWKLDSLIRGESAKPAQWSGLADSVAELLPGARTPLTVADSKIVQQYRNKPVDVYDATPKARDACDRELWTDAMVRQMTAKAAEPEADLAGLASQANKFLPDRPEIGRQFLQQWAEREAARVTTPLPAAQVRKLAETFRVDLGDPKRGYEVLRQWLDARRKKLSARDADGRVRLAKDYRAELKDDETAVALLLEAVQIEADLPEAATELGRLGFAKSPTGWVRSNDPSAAAPANAGSRLPEKNMTFEQVRNIMGDPRPADRARYAFRRNGKLTVTEQWIYRGPPDLCVTFVIMPDNDARVIAINTPPQK